MWVLRGLAARVQPGLAEAYRLVPGVGYQPDPVAGSRQVQVEDSQPVRVGGFLPDLEVGCRLVWGAACPPDQEEVSQLDLVEVSQLGLVEVVRWVQDETMTAGIGRILIAS